MLVPLSIEPIQCQCTNPAPIGKRPIIKKDSIGSGLAIASRKKWDTLPSEIMWQSFARKVWDMNWHIYVKCNIRWWSLIKLNLVNILSSARLDWSTFRAAARNIGQLRNCNIGVLEESKLDWVSNQINVPQFLDYFNNKFITGPVLVGHPPVLRWFTKCLGALQTNVFQTQLLPKELEIEHESLRKKVK